MPGQFQGSIIIATYNRAAYLAKCLEALAALDVEPNTIEIIVVDNNSTDNTAEVVHNFAQRCANLNVQYLFEKTQGAALARNTAVAQSSGEILYFLDDDTIPSPGWLQAMKQGFCDPQIGCVGGPAILDFQGQIRPPWLYGDLQGLLSGFGLPYHEPTEVTKIPELPFLCNMAVRREVIAQVGAFRPDLGRAGSRKLAGEETELIGRMIKAGWKIMYLPDAHVRHLVTPERLHKRYIYEIGRGLAATHVYLTLDDRILLIGRWFMSDLWYATRMWLKLAAALLVRKPLWFDDYMRFWMVAIRVPIRLKALRCGVGAFDI